MSPLLLIAAAVAGAFALFSGKKPAAPGASGTTIKVPSQPTSIQTPIGKVTVTPPAASSTQTGTTITVPEIVIAPSDAPLDLGLPSPPEVIAATNASPTLTDDEQVSVESSLPDDLYRMAMASKHPAYVVAAAARLAAAGDASRAMDLTLRIANWGH
jgi:hypothetical protein